MPGPAFNEFSRLRRVALRHARDAYRDSRTIDAAWRDLNYHAPPDFDLALKQYEFFAQTLADAGSEIVYLAGDPDLGLDSIYVRDATLVTPKGLIACAMGKPQRDKEPGVARETIPVPKNGCWLGMIEPPGLVEGGDVVWFDESNCAVALGYRTNAAGIEQMRHLLGPEITVEAVPLPHYKGPDDVFHLMSVLSPLDHDLLLVYSPLMPVIFRQRLLGQGFRLVEVPDEEFATMGCNVLALAPRKVLMIAGNPKTRRRLEDAGCDVIVYEGSEISTKGEGGPTCLTRPLLREYED